MNIGLGLLAVSLVALVAVQLRDPHWGLVLMAGILPVALLLPKTPVVSSFAVVAGGSSVLALAMTRRKGELFGNPSGRTIYYAASLLLLEMFLGEFLKPPSSFNAPFHYPFLHAQLLLLVFVTDQVFRDQSRTKQLMLFYASVNVVAALFSILSARGQLLLKAYRMSGMVDNANEYGTYTGIAVLVLVYFAVNSESVLGRYASMLFAAALSVPLILSGSRGAFFFLAVAGAYETVRMRSRHVFYLLLGLVALYLAWGLIPSQFVHRMVEAPRVLMRGDETVGARFSYWRYALELWSSSPVFGIGSGMFIETTVSTLRFGIPRMTHNAYVAYLCGNGIVGLALFLTVVVSAARNFETAARAARSDIKMRNLSLAWQSVLLFLVLVGLKSDFHAVKILWMSFGLSNALLASTTTERFTQPRAVKTKRSVSLPSLKPVSVHARGNEGRE